MGYINLSCIVLEIEEMYFQVKNEQVLVRSKIRKNLIVESQKGQFRPLI